MRFSVCVTSNTGTGVMLVTVPPLTPWPSWDHPARTRRRARSGGHVEPDVRTDREGHGLRIPSQNYIGQLHSSEDAGSGRC